MSLKARQELLSATTKRYRKASESEKRIILDEFVATTNYHRKYAIHLLNNRPADRVTGEKVRASFGNGNTMKTFRLLWYAFGKQQIEFALSAWFLFYLNS